MKKVINESNVHEALKLGLTLILDYNEDRQVKYSKQQLQNKDENILDFLVENDDKEKALIYLNTNGKTKVKTEYNQIFSEPLKLYGEGEYNLNAVKQIRVTSDYLSLEKNVIKCQTEESFENCTTQHHIDHLLDQCHCLPLSIRVSDIVVKYYFMVHKLT